MVMCVLSESTILEHRVNGIAWRGTGSFERQRLGGKKPACSPKLSDFMARPGRITRI